jgi:hypothetical protein
VSGPPSLSIILVFSTRSSGQPLKNFFSLTELSGVPSPEVRLSAA